MSDADSDQKVVSFQPSALLSTTAQKIFVKGLELDMFIGVLDAEKEAKQRVMVSVELTVEPNTNWHADNITDVVSYADVIERIQIIAEHGHVGLVETFAEMIIEACFDDASVSAVQVSVEKPDIISNAKGVGVSILRSRA